MVNTKTTELKRERKVSAYKIKLVRNLSAEAESRNEPVKGAYPGGRFKRYFDILRTYFQPLIIANMLTLLFMLPIVGWIFFFEIFGYEAFGYILAKINPKAPPFFMTNIGIGLSSTMPLMQAKSMLLASYKVMVAGIAVFAPVAALGATGNIYICTKFIWGESLLLKKDKYGNDSPRIATEFFRGIKKHAKKMVPSITIVGFLLCGSILLILEFVDSLWLNTVNAGHYVGMIIGILIALTTLLLAIIYIPFNVIYADTKAKTRLKNAAILTAAFPFSTVIVLLIALAPFALIFAGSMVRIIATVILLSFGFTHTCLTITNFADYNSENIIQPLYLQEIKTQMRTERKKAKVVNVKAKQNYKKMKKK